MIHCPAYEVGIRNGWSAGGVFKSEPPIDISPLIDWVASQGTLPPGSRIADHLPMNAIDLPPSMRAALESMMLEGPSGEERMAAARSA